ncbi:MAG: type I pullulanase [bacterium]
MKQENSYPNYDGGDLGATLRAGGADFRVWAPAAAEVTLNLYPSGDGTEATARIPMARSAGGTWAASAPVGHGAYYTYSIDGREVMDPCARAVGLGGERGMVADLRRTDPPGFREVPRPPLRSPCDAVIWEVHVRDFSIALPGSRYPGKYLAFTEEGLKNSAGFPVGLDYLKWLGVTHVHLLPVFDFASLDESLPAPGYNWGYDPKNYNAPEGSYATDSRRAEVRIRELKELILALHRAGIGVILDVVYNHTWRTDTFETLAPGYFYRRNADGSFSNGSGCGNEIASEKPMVRKFILDSLRFWAEEYLVDGFRFDLMGLHDIATMREAEKVIRAVNPSALLYGEGWTGGPSPLPEGDRATRENAARLPGYSFFNDVMRDGLKGNTFNPADRGYLSGNAAAWEAVAFGLRGGFSGRDIAYLSSHDNHTLRDKLTLACPGASEAELGEMTRFGASLIFLSRGVPFLMAGEEFLRTKYGDPNSYRSSDWVNRLDWECLRPGSEPLRTAEHYRSLLRQRKEYAFLRDTAPTILHRENDTLQLQWNRHAQALVDPVRRSVSLTIGA